ncbi:hypothetical protein [Kribbella sp. NPDC051718]|uniref:hypothetical protein n=1 Tax=Kribbella sp. NPDC051718 TaxID=3155168 RepID=UPI00343F935B
MTATLERVAPAYFWRPERRGSYGDEAIDLAQVAGVTLDAEQKHDVDAMLSYKAGGRWLTLEQAIIEARQNGKTKGVLQTVTIFDLWMLPPDRIVWTAHLFKTARDAFNDFITAIETSSELSRRVKRISYSHGEESIELTTGALLEFLARSMGGGRGLGGKRFVADEALILSSTSMGALMPTLSARADPQITYGSSAGKLGSDHLRRVRNRGRAGGDPSLVYIEYCAPGGWGTTPCAARDECVHGETPGCYYPTCRDGIECSHLYGVEGCSLDNEEYWKRANHSLGRVRPNGTGITYDYVRAERRTLDPIEFGRERNGWWEDPPNAEEEDPAVDLVRWSELADPLVPAPTETVTLAVDVPPDHSTTSIAVAWEVDDRIWVMVTELVGTSKAAKKVAELCEAYDVADVSLHAGGPAGTLVAAIEDELEGSELELRTISTQEAAQATGAFVDLIKEPLDDFKRPTGQKLLGHLDQLEVNNALKAARLRDVGDGLQLWDRKDLTNLAPLIAVTLAANGYVKHGRDSFFGGGWR